DGVHALLDLADEGFHQTRLADTRLPTDEHDAAPAPGRVSEQRTQLLEVCLAFQQLHLLPSRVPAAEPFTATSPAASCIAVTRYPYSTGSRESGQDRPRARRNVRASARHNGPVVS